MSVTTGSGDKGKTSLWTGERVPKNSVRVESYGSVDELNSFIGEAKHHVKSIQVGNILHDVQRDLFKVAGQLASRDDQYVEPVTEEDVERITALIKKLEAEINLKGFVIPGSTIQSAKLDICRTIARRAERRVLALKEKEQVPDQVHIYLNRVSDLLFILARYEEFLEGKIEYK